MEQTTKIQTDDDDKDAVFGDNVYGIKCLHMNVIICRYFSIVMLFVVAFSRSMLLAAVPEKVDSKKWALV